MIKEIRLLVSRTKEHPLEAYDIISDPKSVVALSLLYNSMVCLNNSLLNPANRRSNGCVAASVSFAISQVRQPTLAILELGVGPW